MIIEVCLCNDLQLLKNTVKKNKWCLRLHYCDKQRMNDPCVLVKSLTVCKGPSSPQSPWVELVARWVLVCRDLGCLSCRRLGLMLTKEVFMKESMMDGFNSSI